MQRKTTGFSWLLSLIGGVLGQGALAAEAPTGQTLYVVREYRFQSWSRWHQ